MELFWPDLLLQIYVAAADDGMKFMDESKACIDLLKKVVTIDRV